MEAGEERNEFKLEEMQLQEDILFAGRYRLMRLLGRGGFSEVWLAEDGMTSLEVAVKVYAPGTGLDAEGIELFSQELSIVYNLNHTNLLKPQHFDRYEGCPYLVLPYCARGSAQKLVGRITEEEAWRFLHDVAAGLEYLHAREPAVIHQDIKPDNVLIDESGHFMITDFGISTKARSTLRKSMPRAENSGGTTAYMGPERFGKRPAAVMASDIWSLGATLFELMTGDAPFGNLGGVLQKNGAEIPDINGDYSKELKTGVQACLALETWDRPTAAILRNYTEFRLRGEKPHWPENKIKTAGNLPPVEKEGRKTESFTDRKTEVFVDRKTEEERGEKDFIQETERNPKSRRGLWVGLGSLAVLAGAVAVYFFFFVWGSESGSHKIEREFFGTCQRVSDFRAYLARYPSGEYVGLARGRIQEFLRDSIAYDSCISQAYPDSGGIHLLAFYDERIEKLESYLTRFPEGHYVQLAQKKIEHLRKEAAQMRQEEEDRQAELSRLNQERRRQEERKRNLTDDQRLAIRKVEFANTDYDGLIIDGFGSPLYSYTQYLAPRIVYDNLADDAKKIKIGIKMYTPEGELHRGNASPAGYTYMRDIDLAGKQQKNVTKNLLSWGNTEGYSYSPGTWRYEIWCNGRLLYKTDCTIRRPVEGISGEVITKHYENGDKYIGTFNASGFRHGAGTYVWADGNRYIGEWREDDMTGNAYYYWANTGDKYIGEYRNDKRNGKGTLYWKSGDRYSGDWVEGVRTGKGTYYYGNGDKYVGDFKDNTLTGQGTYYYANGSIEAGRWENNTYMGN